LNFCTDVIKKLEIILMLGDVLKKRILARSADSYIPDGHAERHGLPPE
jgi:hypothetical protein